MNKKNLAIGVVVVLLVGLFIHAWSSEKGQTAGAAPAGSSFSSAKAPGQQFTLSSSTIFAQQNTDGNGRAIKAVDFFLQTGATSTTYTIACATSSTQFWPTTANPNPVLQQSLQTIGAGTTTGAGLYISSSSPGVMGQALGAASTTARIWANADWMVCKETSSPANDLLPSTADGVITFPVIPGI